MSWWRSARRVELRPFATAAEALQKPQEPGPEDCCQVRGSFVGSRYTLDNTSCSARTVSSIGESCRLKTLCRDAKGQAKLCSSS